MCNMTIQVYRNVTSPMCVSQLVEAAKVAGERTLLEKKEKLMLELQKLKQRVDEFNDYGELDMMQQYVQDVRAVQKRLIEAQELIEWVNKEEALYKYPVSKFSEVDEITSSIDPFMRLFQVVFKWQRAEKKWVTFTWFSRRPTVKCCYVTFYCVCHFDIYEVVKKYINRDK